LRIIVGAPLNLLSGQTWSAICDKNPKSKRPTNFDVQES